MPEAKSDLTPTPEAAAAPGELSAPAPAAKRAAPRRKVATRVRRSADISAKIDSEEDNSPEPAPANDAPASPRKAAPSRARRGKATPDALDNGAAPAQAPIGGVSPSDPQAAVETQIIPAQRANDLARKTEAIFGRTGDEAVEAANATPVPPPVVTNPAPAVEPSSPPPAVNNNNSAPVQQPPQQQFQPRDGNGGGGGGGREFGRRRFGRDRFRDRDRNRDGGGQGGQFQGGNQPPPPQQRAPQGDYPNRGGDRGGYRQDQNRGPQPQPGGQRFDDNRAPIPSNEPTTIAEGVIELTGKGFGFLREPKRNFVQMPNDIFVTPELCRQFNLRDGVYLKGEVRRSSRGLQMFNLTEINGGEPAAYREGLPFEELTTINPKSRVKLETVPERYTTRVMDLMTPIGKGQRGLIVAPPRTGKTTLLQHIGDAVCKNHPDMHLIILLVDERPEEVTEIRRTLPKAEIMASSNDNDLKSHTKIAMLAIERAKRLVEAGRDVFLLLDSITRMGRAFNNSLGGGGGATMSGGIGSRALEIPRKIFAAARNTEEAGSLTIIATALIETGSRMDDVIFQEFKGTGNMELVLDRKISDLRIFPAVDIFQSGTRRDELLLAEWELDKINVIRRGLAGHKPVEAIERLLSFLKKFPTNAQMLTSLPG